MSQEFLYICELLLKKYRINYDRSFLKEELMSHPDYPSIWAFTDVLASLNICLKVLETNWASLLNVKGIPFLAHIKENVEHFVLVINVNDKGITYIDDFSKRTKTISKDDFLQIWDRRIAYITDFPTLNIKEKVSLAKDNILKFVGLLFTIILLFLLCVEKHADSYLIGQLLIKLIGILFSLVLVYQKRNDKPLLIHKVCNLNKRIDCNAVLKSNASKIGGIEMSDIGFIYFIWSFILLVVSIINENSIEMCSFLGLISLCAIPYMLFSVYYQSYVIQKFCLFCIAIISLLLLEILCFVFYFSDFTYPTVSSCITAIFILICTSICWYFYRKRLGYISLLEDGHIRYLTLKKNCDIFYALWKKENSVLCTNLQSVFNTSNKLSVDVALSLHCKYCSLNFKQIKGLIEKTDSYSFVFYFSWNDKDEEQHIFIHRLISVYYFQGEKSFLYYLQQWYKLKEYSVLNIENVPKLIPDNMFLNYKNSCLDWFKSNHITNVPVVYVLGKRLPAIYQIKDLYYFQSLLNNLLIKKQ